MKITSVLIVSVFGLLMVATGYGDEPKSYRVALPSARIGTADLYKGEYKMLVHRDGNEPTVRLTELKTGNVSDIAAKVESADKKCETTEVHFQEVDGTDRITEIRIGGTKLRVVFQQGPSL